MDRWDAVSGERVLSARAPLTGAASQSPSAPPDSSYSKKSVYTFAASDDAAGRGPTEMTGILTETDGADDTCPSLAGATALTYDLVAVPA